MPATLTDEQCLEALHAFVSHGKQQAPAARALGLPRNTFLNRLQKAYARNLDGALPLDVAPGKEINHLSHRLDADGNITQTTVRLGPATADTEYEVPEGHVVERETVQTDAQGRIVRSWHKTKATEATQDEIEEALRLTIDELLDGITAAPRPRALSTPSANPDLLNFHPLPDLHIGAFVWGKQTGTDWDLKLAISEYRRVMKSLMDRSPPARIGVVLGGGDLLHADDEMKKTRRSGNVLDVDSRYPKVLSEAQKLMVYQVDLALDKYEKVHVRILPGNHDEDSAVAVSHFLAAWYRNEPRAIVDTDPSEFWFFEHGKVMLAGNHGHNCKVAKMPGIMAAYRAEMWGRTLHRHAHGFHVHHRERDANEANGADWEVHRTPAPPDGYHHSAGYVSGRSMQTITYHAERGEFGRSVETLF